MSTTHAASPAVPGVEALDHATMCAAMLRAVAQTWRDQLRSTRLDRAATEYAQQLVAALDDAAARLDEPRGLPATAQDQATQPPGDDRYKLLVESVKDYAIFMLDPQGQVLTWNAGAQRLKGYNANEIIGRHFSAFYPPDDLATGKPARELLIASQTGRYEEEGWRIRKDGTRFWANVVITALRDALGVLVGFGKVTRDLTERKHAEEELRLSEERFRLMVGSVTDYAILFLDAQGRIASWNAGAQRIKGWRPEEAIGQHFRMFYTEEAVASGHPERELEVAARDGRYEEEGWRVRKDGSRFWANVVITTMRAPHGALLGFVKVTRDITERREAQLALEHAAADLEKRVNDRTQELEDVNRKLEATNHELESFGYSVSHDLRAPLRALDGFSKLVLMSAADKLDDTERDHLARVRAAAQRMSQLIDDMLSLSQLSRATMKPTEVDLTAIAREIVADLRRSSPERHVDVTIQEGMSAHGDHRLLRIALENLLGNAWKFTRKRPDATVEVGAVERDGRRVWHVRDNGAGFDPTYASKLFIPFQRLHSTSDFEGTGVGLATVQRIVRRHGGDIWFDSAPDRGATFFFTLATP